MAKKKPTDKTRLIVWVVAGGLCARCRTNVLDESIEYVPLGEVAHNAGRSQGGKTPRLRREMTEAERNQPENLLLLCRDCHKLVDSEVGQGIYGIDELRELKVQHEEQVRDLLSLMTANTTLIMRVASKLHDDTTVVTRQTAMAVAAAHRRVPVYLLRQHRSDVAIDLRSVPEDDPDYWQLALRRVQDGVESVAAAIEDGLAEHVTLFALARLPILVALGWLLDDTIPTNVVHLSHNNPFWMPNPEARARDFGTDLERGTSGSSDGVIVLRLSGSPDVSRLPDHLRGLARVTVSPVDGDPEPHIADSTISQRRIDESIQAALIGLEDELGTPETLHVIAAAPNDSLVQLGRRIDRRTYKTVKVYDRHAGTYREVCTLAS